MPKFKNVIDQFADTKIVRYKVEGFDNLSLKQKEYIYYLSNATLAGRDIIWDQLYHYNIIIRKSLETILTTFKGSKETKDYKLFLEYAKYIFCHKGVYNQDSLNKIIPKCSREYFKTLILKSDESKFILNKKSVDDFSQWLIDIIYQIQTSDDILLNSPTNFYEYVGAEDAFNYYQNKIKKDDKEPVQYGLNSKLINIDGELKEEVYKVNGKYSEVINKIIYWLEKANKVSESKVQKEYTNKLIEFYQTGDLKKWDEFNKLWVVDDKSNIEYVNGFIETYSDPLGIKGSWEAFTFLKDNEATKLTKIIAANAQWFEDNSPIDAIYKKHKVKGISAKVINVVMAGGDADLSRVLGINLPNSHWIREQLGSKSFSISNFTKALNNANEEGPKNIKDEFCYSNQEKILSKKYGEFAGELHTHLHELGHSSGKLMEGITNSSLGDYHASLEEARADLFALYYMMDEKLLDLKIMPTLDAGKTKYDTYIRNGLITQLTRIELGKDVTQAHMQGRKLISEYALELGKNEKVISMRKEKGKTFYMINDYNKLREIFGKLLNIIQKIISEGDYEQAKRLVEKYGRKIDYKLHSEVLDRYKRLGLKPHSALMNPEIKPIIKNEKIIDYKIVYANDYLKQQLDYGKEYSYLENFEIIPN